MKVLIVEPGYSPYEADLENTPAALTAVLESEQYTAAFPFDNTVIAAVYGGDAEKPYNRTLGSIGLVQGRFIVCGSRRGRFVGLTREQAQRYSRRRHRVTHSVHLGDREIFLAVQQDAPLPFYVGYMEVSYELGLARFSGIEGTTEYTEAWEMFIQRLQKQIEQVRAQRQEHHAPQLLTEADCIRDSRAGDYEGKVLVMRPGVLRPEYWNAAHQLYFAVDGNGARAGGHGTKVFCINIYTGEHTYIRRTDVMGAVKPDRLPGWAKEKAAALRQDYQREKAAEKQRLEEFLTARREKETGETLRRPRAAQTRGKEKGGER